MRTVLLIMKRKSVAQGLMLKLRDVSDFQLAYEAEYVRAAATIRVHDARVALIEVAESWEYGIAYCLELCARLREETPGCKLLLMCPENSSESKHAAVDVMRSGEIDDFVYYNVSMDYLQSKLAVLTIGTEELYF